MRPQLHHWHLLTLGCAVALALVGGCARWNNAESPWSEPEPAVAEARRRAPLIQAEFIAVPHSEPALGDDSLWQWVDETRVEMTQRQRLRANGLRAGVVTNEENLRRRLDQDAMETGTLDEFLSEAAIQSEMSHGIERFPLRFGRRYELPLRQPQSGSHVTLVRLEGQTEGRTLERPQHLLAITARRAPSFNQVELQLRPEIQHGELKQQWITSDSALRIDARRETWSLSALDLDVPISEGELLILTAGDPVGGLGSQMFIGSGADGADQQTVLLIKATRIPRP